MAFSLPNPKVPRTRPVHYYEGMMKKKGPGEKVYKKYWTGLLGNALYFYNHHKDVQYMDVISLEDFVSLSDDNSTCKIPTEAKLTLQLKKAKVHLKVDSTEYREMWKGFILTVIQLKVPTDLSLLPGPRHMMSEVLAKELQRRAELEKDYDEAKDEELLPCFYNVTRLEAQDLLEKYPECGNLIMRPGRDSTSVSISTCQNLNGTNMIRHYKVNLCRGVYIIEVEQPVRCKTLLDVMNYFVEKTSKCLIPFRMDDDYEDHISFVARNEENVETVVRNTGSPRQPGPQDTKGAGGYPRSSRNPPPIPSEPLSNEMKEEEQEEEDEDSDEEQDQMYMNDNMDQSRRASSSMNLDSGSLGTRPPRLPPKPVAKPGHAEDTPGRRRSSVNSTESRDVCRQAPQLPKYVATPKERGGGVAGSKGQSKPTSQQRPSGRLQINCGQGKAGIEDELKRVLQLRYKQC